MDGQEAEWTNESQIREARAKRVMRAKRTSVSKNRKARSKQKSKSQPVAKRHMVSGTLSPLYTVFGLKLGCSGAAALIRDEVL